jgi:hypothetical protein
VAQAYWPLLVGAGVISAAEELVGTDAGVDEVDAIGWPVVNSEYTGLDVGHGWCEPLVVFSTQGSATELKEK